MTISLCICPDFISKNIGDTKIYIDIFVSRLAVSDNQIVFDQEEKLESAYINAVATNIDAYNNFKAWKALLDASASGKKLLSSSCGASAPNEVVYKTISSAATTFNKVILTTNNSHYSNFITKLKQQKIHIFNLNNISTQQNTHSPFKNLCHEETEEDLEWILQRLGRQNSKLVDEDSYNDYLRDMLLAKKYEVKDQTREGKSLSGKNAGEIDIIIEDRSDIFTIIEAMKLNALNKNYINDHYKKLISNYNPLGVKRTFLVTYYTGNHFSEWWDSYVDHINNLNLSNLTGLPQITSQKISETQTSYCSIKKAHHHFLIENENSICSHLAIQLRHS